MKNKNTKYIIFLCISSGYLIYNFLFNEQRFIMMRHHYGYYDSITTETFFLNTILVVLSYLVIGFSLFQLLWNNKQLNRNALDILDQRLTNGSISIDEYNEIKKILAK